MADPQTTEPTTRLAPSDMLWAREFGKREGRPLLAVLDQYFGITTSLAANGCEHGFKPAKSCPNADCEARLAHEAWENLNGQ